MNRRERQSRGRGGRSAGVAASFAAGLAAGLAGGFAVLAGAARRPPAGPSPAAPSTSRRRSSDSPPGPVDRSWPQVFEALDTGVCIVDAADRVAFANAEACSLGVCHDSQLEPEALRSLAGHVRATGAPRVAELELERSGDSVAVRARVAPLDEDHVAVELTDVSELHRVERVRRDFVANVGHELKTPVGALQLLSEALADAVDDPVAAGRFTARIQHESSRMARLVSELLELSRLQGAEPLPSPDVVNVDRVIVEAMDRGRIAADSKDIELRRRGREGLRVSGSESQLVTALSNLIGNAVAYSTNDTVVTVGARLREGSVCISVSDQGIGIAPEDKDRIFERFYRADPARSRATGGTGLGLAIVKHIVGNHGGSIDVSSMPGNGATFTLALPAVARESDNSPPSPDEIDANTNDRDASPSSVDTEKGTK